MPIYPQHFFVSQPLHVSGIFVAHHQEVYCIYTIQQSVRVVLFRRLSVDRPAKRQSTIKHNTYKLLYTRVGTLIVATIYLQQIQNRYMFRSFTVLQCSHQHCVQPVASDVEVVGYL